MQAVNPIKLKKRADFVDISKQGLYKSSLSLVVQYRRRRSEKISYQDDDRHGFLYGITASKKVGNAVIRNKVKRRIREAIRSIALSYYIPNYSYVIIARSAAKDLPYQRLQTDLKYCLRSIKTREQ